MIFWTHLPVRQWLHVEQDSTPTVHPHPWVVRNGMFIVARCSKQSEAESIVRDVELASARAIARDIANEETIDMTDLKKLIETAGKKFAEDVVRALRTTSIGDLMDDKRKEKLASFEADYTKEAMETHRRKKPVAAKPPKTKAQAREGQQAYWVKSSRDGRSYAVLPDFSLRSYGRTRDLVYKLRKEGYTVLPLKDDSDATVEQRTFLLACL